MNDLREEIIKQVQDRLVADMDKMALDMILRGMFPSQGWRVGYRTWTEEEHGKVVFHSTCFPVKEDKAP